MPHFQSIKDITFWGTFTVTMSSSDRNCTDHAKIKTLNLIGRFCIESMHSKFVHLPVLTMQRKLPQQFVSNFHTGALCLLTFNKYMNFGHNVWRNAHIMMVLVCSKIF